LELKDRPKRKFKLGHGVQRAQTSLKLEIGFLGVWTRILDLELRHFIFAAGQRLEACLASNAALAKSHQ
jgi:hypothetical protein